VCTGRFYDFFDKRGGRWAIVRRQPIYEKDRLDPIEPGTKLSLDPTLLARFPEGYRHLGYLQTKAGFTVRLGLPGCAAPKCRSSTPKAPRGSRLCETGRTALRLRQLRHEIGRSFALVRRHDLRFAVPD